MKAIKIILAIVAIAAVIFGAYLLYQAYRSPTGTTEKEAESILNAMSSEQSPVSEAEGKQILSVIQQTAPTGITEAEGQNILNALQQY